jgi:putative ABC transport system permease protein
MLLQEFYSLVVLSNIIAWPLAYFVMKSILQQNYAYPVVIKAWIFIFAAGVTFLSATFAVLTHTMRAAYSEPVKNLRYE